MITIYKIGGDEEILASEAKVKPSIGEEIESLEHGRFIVERVIHFYGKINNLGNQPQLISVWCRKVKE